MKFRKWNGYVVKVIKVNLFIVQVGEFPSKRGRFGKVPTWKEGNSDIKGGRILNFRTKKFKYWTAEVMNVDHSSQKDGVLTFKIGAHM